MEENLHGIGDGSFFGIEIVLRVLLVFGNGHPGAEGVNARIGGDLVLVVFRREMAEDEADVAARGGDAA